MPKETKKNKKTSLKKEHFEILLEDIQSSVKAIAEGHILLNTKIDTKIDKLTNELHETKDELIFLIKATVNSAEERLNKRIDSVEERLTKQIKEGDEAVVEQLTKKIEDGDRAVMEYTDQKIAEVNRNIDEVKDMLRVHTSRLDDHEERILRLESKN